MRNLALSHVVVIGLFVALFCGSQAQAAILFQDDFEEARLEDSGWGWSDSYCGRTVPRIEPCQVIDITTEQVHNGTRSLKLTYNVMDESQNQAISQHFAPQYDLYTRYYYRTSAFTYNNISGTTKHIYWKNDTGYQYPDGYSANIWGSREMSFVMQVIAELCPTSGTGPYGTCNFHPNMARKPLADDTWYCIEEHVKMNTAGVADGNLELWVDGTQTIGYYNQTWRGAEVSGSNGNSSLASFNWFQIFKQVGLGIAYIDQFAFGTTRIGCSGQPIQAIQDIIPPSSPSGLFIR
jgi:hypothetical protein